MSYDLIGDIHGCADTLRQLLTDLGYSETHGVYEHPTRQVIFLGDFVDRGPKQRETLEIVRPMIDNDNAMSVMGNHEFNAIAFATRRREGDEYLRPRNKKHTDQHEAFLEEYEHAPEDWSGVIDWFRSLPLWLELDGLRVVHAVWASDTIRRLEDTYGSSSMLNDEFLFESSEQGTWQYDAIEQILKGQEVELPPGSNYLDKDKNPRTAIRTRWWDDSAVTYRDAYLGPPEFLESVPDDDLTHKLPLAYDKAEPPVFIGHYWQTGTPKPLAANVACLDYSVGKGGSLAAYRWDGGQELSAEKFVTVERVDP